MSNGHMLVTFGSIEQAAMDTDHIANQIDGQLDDLKSYLAPLVATWAGQASENYQGLQRKWDQSAEALNAILRDISNAMRQANANYSQAEDANASMWGG